MRKFFKTVYTFTVLSEDTPPSEHVPLNIVLEECASGAWSGDISGFSVQEITAVEAAQALIEQNSDPEFFNLDENGTDLEVKNETV